MSQKSLREIMGLLNTKPKNGESMSDYVSKSDKWDVDQNRSSHSGKWSCKLYHNNHQIHETGPDDKLAPCREAMEAWINTRIADSSQKESPATFAEVIWNDPKDLTSPTKPPGGSSSYTSTPGLYNTGNPYNSGGGWTGNTYKHCDHDPLDDESKVFLVKSANGHKVAIIGATKSKIKALYEGQNRLIVNCSAYSLKDWKVVCDKPFKSIPESMAVFSKKDYTYYPAMENYGDEVVLDWTDGGMSPVGPQFFIDLYAWIKSAKFPYQEVVFTCMGGHGRTGTAIAALALISGVFSTLGVSFKNDPTREPKLYERAYVHVRDKYCDKAIETTKQFDYLEMVEKHMAAQASTTPMVVLS